jgi:hypothetical protein
MSRVWCAVPVEMCAGAGGVRSEDGMHGSTEKVTGKSKVHTAHGASDADGSRDSRVYTELTDTIYI